MKISFFRFIFSIVFMLILVLDTDYVFSQKIDPNGYNIFTYPDGSKSSEGYMKNGKPDGFWKSYYPNGPLKTSGNRKNEKLDSVWKFYDREGFLTEIIDYKMGVKSGYHKKYRLIKDSNFVNNVLISKELYVENLKNGKSYYYDDRGRLERTIEFEKDYKNGFEKHYDTTGNVILIIRYSFNNITNSEKLNRVDKYGRKQGIWKSFFGNEKLQSYANYLNDTLNGYYREYNIYGELIKSEFYRMGVLQNLSYNEDSEKEYEVKKEFFDNGAIKSTGTFLNEKPIGIHRTYNRFGNVTSSKSFNDDGTLDAIGIVDKDGKRLGKWKYLYEDGSTKSEGEYENGKKEGKWIYYFNNGNTEQIGKFNKGRPEGAWIWFYENANTRRKGNFLNGRETGLFIELTEEGDTLSKGNYNFGLKEGEWKYSVNDHLQIGKYTAGKRNGVWKYYYSDGTLKFEGNFIEGYPDGKHKNYYPSGNIKLISIYSLGNKTDKWRKYDDEGNLITITEYKGGEKYKIDGQKIRNK